MSYIFQVLFLNLVLLGWTCLVSFFPDSYWKYYGILSNHYSNNKYFQHFTYWRHHLEYRMDWRDLGKRNLVFFLQKCRCFLPIFYAKYRPDVVVVLVVCSRLYFSFSFFVVNCLNFVNFEICTYFQLFAFYQIIFYLISFYLIFLIMFVCVFVAVVYILKHSGSNFDFFSEKY